MTIVNADESRFIERVPVIALNNTICLYVVFKRWTRAIVKEQTWSFPANLCLLSCEEFRQLASCSQPRTAASFV
jgi:hypothetical protein